MTEREFTIRMQQIQLRHAEATADIEERRMRARAEEAEADARFAKQRAAHMEDARRAWLDENLSGLPEPKWGGS